MALLAVVIATSLLAGLLTYRRVLAETSTLFDYQLRQMALSLRTQIPMAPRLELPPDQADSDFVIQIWDPYGTRAYISRPGLPLINATALRRVTGDVQEAVDAGARVLTGGSADGPCYRPTVLADVPAGARIHTEETFGPVLVAQPVADADEAVAIANSTRYGLSAGLITGDNQRGFALARRIDSGVVHVNDQTVADEPQLPLGGMKDSGWGRSGPASMHDFTEIQWITTREGTGHFPI